MSAPAQVRAAAGTPSLASAAQRLQRQAVQADETLAGLPPRPERSPAQQRTADAVHARCRAARTHLMRTYGAEVYDTLTDGRRHRYVPADLADAAATAFPGLVPDRARIAAERTRHQPAKEGYEIDQGIFFWGVLRHQRSGLHLLDAARQPTARSLAALEEFRRTGRLALDTVTLERRAGVGLVTVHNSRYLNAEDDALADDMETAVDLVLLDDAVRVGVVRGAPMTHPRYAGRRIFSAGINLTHLYRGQISFVNFLLRRELGYLAKILRGLSLGEDVPAPEKPWLAAVDGFAIGGGLQLLLVFDNVIAQESAYFSLPAAQEGIVPGVSNLRLPRMVGARLARQFIIGGRRLEAREPEARLLCDDVVPEQAMDQAVDAAAARLCEPGVVANRHMLHVAEEPADTFREYLAEFARVQAERLYSADVTHRLESAWLHRSR